MVSNMPSPPSPSALGPRAAEPPTSPVPNLPLLAVLFVGLFGVLLASFPERNSDIWKHLVAGREIASRPGEIGPAWIFDLTTYAVYSTFGGGVLVMVKALLCGVIAIVVLRMSSEQGGWRLPLAVSGLAVLAVGSRLLLQPATLSVLLLTISLWFILRDARPAAEEPAWWPGWRLVALFAVWGNINGRFVLGLSVVALIWSGRLMDSRPPVGFWRGLRRRATGIAILAAAGCVSPSHVNNLRVPPELRSAVDSLRAEEDGAVPTVNTPFSRSYLTNFRESTVALAYFPLLALGLVSFLLNRKRWRWAWFLPWVALGIASGIQARLIPFFAVLAGPVTAWNLVAFFADRGTTVPIRPRVRSAVWAITGALAIAFLVCAWPGWLQGPPFEPRRWAVEPPVAIQHGAGFLERAQAGGLWRPGTRTLHVSPDTASGFEWFYPEDRGLRDESTVALLLMPDEAEKARQQLRASSVSRVVVNVADPDTSSREVLDRLLADPDEWPVLHLTGGVVVFGWRDPVREGGVDPYALWEVDFARLAYRPDSTQIAPPTRPAIDRRWWHAFWKPAPPPRPAGRDEAMVLLKKSSAMIGSAPSRHLAVWEAGQTGGLIGAASGWFTPHGPVDAMLRLAYINPPVPENAPPGTPLPPITRLAFGLEQRFAFGRGHTPVGILYAALRAARRAVAENPTDASAYYILGQTYAALVRTTSEQSWAVRVPQLMRLRQLQASAALNRAVRLNPNLAEAHLELGRLYLSINLLDVAAAHLRAYRDLPVRWGGPKKGDQRAEAVLAELARLTEALDTQTREFAQESAHSSVGDRATMAVRRGLGGEARDLLLKSDISAFGTQGMELELDLLLKTGRPEEVVEWMTPELRNSLGAFTYHWFRAQAYLALGEYTAADTELLACAEADGQFPLPAQVGTEVAGVVGKSLLDEQPGVYSAPRVIMRTLSEFDFRTRMSQIGQRLSRAAEVMVLRGLIALEAGTIDRARDSFRAALTYCPDRWGGGQLDFNGRWVAWECLGLIESVDATPARPPAP